ncbi:RNA 2',3'-cyclic phosphodiesterase [Streptomyces sp. CB01635]|uniref:RNA 2',3'-cyclic phosphodiesterase n=1 Tax=unclassified Streptomyces TaxID=2593676 RepID=UPI000C27A60E|nr:RNA 2',3'-cyclic phosphodiesterase [Streptomyces sp. CB01635]PJN09212.1 RNA 2',3'-cyclic phosphodiesterase [Streptomyces sp. CB01635]
MRLFAAVLPPDEAVAELGRAVSQLKGSHGLEGAEGLRWTGLPGWHFTLAFYGEVPEETVPELSRRLERAAARTAPFPLALRGGGHFGDRALWVGASGDVAALRRLAERAGAAARKAGLDTEDHRHYRPHLTLARGSGTVHLKPYVAALDSFTGEQWTVGELALVRSRLPRSGVRGEQPRYEKVGGWPLSATG